MFSHPALNASLNGISALLLAGGYAAIRAGKRDVHKVFMVSAFTVSTIFLVSYVVYHLRVKQLVLFQGQGWIRPVYFTLLTSHTIRAVEAGRNRFSEIPLERRRIFLPETRRHQRSRYRRANRLARAGLRKYDVPKVDVRIDKGNAHESSFALLPQGSHNAVH